MLFQGRGGGQGRNIENSLSIWYMKSVGNIVYEVAVLEPTAQTRIFDDEERGR